MIEKMSHSLMVQLNLSAGFNGLWHNHISSVVYLCCTVSLVYLFVLKYMFTKTKHTELASLPDVLSECRGSGRCAEVHLQPPHMKKEGLTDLLTR